MDYIFTCFLCVMLSYHTWTDMREMLLYDSVTLALAVVGLLHSWHRGALGDAAWGAVVLLGIMLLLYVASRGGMGEGDVKLAPALGLWLGLEQGLLGLLLAFVSGGIVGILLLVLSRRGCKQPVPFGPFLCGGAVVAYFWGQELLNWYLLKFF